MSEMATIEVYLHVPGEGRYHVSGEIEIEALNDPKVDLLAYLMRAVGAGLHEKRRVA